MARVELPSGGWVEYRDKLMAGDRFVVQDAVSIKYDGDNSRRIALGLGNDICNALLGRIITKWSFDVPVPGAENPMPDRVIGNAMDLDDYNVLAKAVEVLVRKVSGMEEDTPKEPGTDEPKP